jgi:hypothetical protein
MTATLAPSTCRYCRQSGQRLNTHGLVEAHTRTLNGTEQPCSGAYLTPVETPPAAPLEDPS